MKPCHEVSLDGWLTIARGLIIWLKKLWPPEEIVQNTTKKHEKFGKTLYLPTIQTGQACWLSFFGDNVDYSQLFLREQAILCRNPNNWPQWSWDHNGATTMTKDHNGHWTMCWGTTMARDFLTTMVIDHNGNRPQWQQTTMDDHNGERPQRVWTTMVSDHNGYIPTW